MSCRSVQEKLARQDSNLESSGPEPDVLPIPPRANGRTRSGGPETGRTIIAYPFYAFKFHAER